MEMYIRHVSTLFLMDFSVLGLITKVADEYSQIDIQRTGTITTARAKILFRHPMIKWYPDRTVW